MSGRGQMALARVKTGEHVVADGCLIEKWAWQRRVYVRPCFRPGSATSNLHRLPFLAELMLNAYGTSAA